MGDRIHDDEVDTSEATVRALLCDQLPAWADAPVTRLGGTGTTNALWRVHGDPTDIVVRLPRMAGGAGGIDTEVALLPHLASTPLADMIRVPRLIHSGSPSTAYPLRWMAAQWLAGDDLWSLRNSTDVASPELPIHVAEVVRVLATLDDMPAADRAPGSRGGPLRPLLDRLHRWLDDPQWAAADLVDVATITTLADEAAELVDEPTPRRFVHGDLIPGNLLLHAGRLDAVIDWGGAGYGDPAQDLAPAWALFDDAQRRRFRAALEVDDASWTRGRVIELEHAVGGVLYYVPRAHPLGDVMARTLDRILADSKRV